MNITEVWFNKVCKLLNNNPLKIKREIFLMRMRGSDQSPFEPEDLAAIEEKKGKIIEERFILRVFKLDIYTELQKNKIYFVGVDVSNGYGEDNSAVTIFDPYTLQPVAEFKSPNIGVKDLIQFLYLLIKKHLPKSILAIERNANGEAVLDHLRNTDILGNIYFDNSKDFIEPGIDDKLDSEGLIRREAARRKLFGIWTGTKSRERMFSLLEGHVKDHKDKFVCGYIIDDIMRLVRSKTGKIVAGEGFHDDNIMSYLMCLYMYYYGNNLHRFGYVRGDLPDKEEQNKGMFYEDIESYLSENDKKFFEGVPMISKSDVLANLDVKTMIENTRGLISERELKNIDSTKKQQPHIGELDEYSLKLRQEMMRAQAESEAFNMGINFVNKYENMDISDNGGEMSLDIFDELNS